ncbi:MAG: HD domain-containing protein [Tissierellia bacterium]|nr:HD domain-containing protein [Tissierellia bacterium]
MIPKEIDYILKRLEENNFLGYIVGGSVRDILMGKEPEDYDLTTDASPNEMKEIFNDYKIVDTGIEFGTLILIKTNVRVEITTFRTEGSYSDGRRPDWVKFVDDLELDLSRRDFTINAIAMDRNRKIYDPFGGKYDIENEIIRAVGDPKKRFKEDYLRILRGIRFKSKLNFTIEENTLIAMKDLAHGLKYISAERIQSEFNKIMLSEIPSRGIYLMEEIGALEIIMPEIMPTVGFDQMTPYHQKTLFDHMLCVVDNCPPKLHLRLAALMHDISKPDLLTIGEDGKGHFYGHEIEGAKLSREILKRLKYSKKTINEVDSLIYNHMKAHEVMKKKAVKRLIAKVGEEYIFDLLDLMIADRICTTDERDIEFLIERKNLAYEILNSNESYSISTLAINGNDIKALGFEEGKIIGEILNYLNDLVLEDEKLNEKEKLIEIIRDKF